MKDSVIVPNIAPSQPAQENVVVLHLIVLDEQKRLLSVLERATRRLRLAIVEIERVIAVEVALDRIQIDENIVEVSDEKEIASHALTTRDRIAIARRAAHQLKILLGYFQVLFGAALLTDGRVDHTLQNRNIIL